MTDIRSSSLEHLFHEKKSIPPNLAFQPRSFVKTEGQYTEMYRESLENSDNFWLKMARELDWIKFPSKACEYRWESDKRIIEHTWFKDGQINVSVNCLDKHALGKNKAKPAIIWQGDEENEVRILTFWELYERVLKFANVLKKKGIRKGDRICLYMPHVPETVIAMLASSRIGAIHSVIFGGFSAEALASRLNDCQAKLLITANIALRGGKVIPLKEIADQALLEAPEVETVIVMRRRDVPCKMQSGRDVFFEDEMQESHAECEPANLNAEDPLFILYTSGSTGKPKGVVHTQAGYLLQSVLTHRYLFDTSENDIYWCTADAGWITGHSYVVYGPLANGCTTLLFEGVPTYPDASRYWRIIDKFKVNVFYTSPTAIRSLVRLGEEPLKGFSLSSLRVLGTVGEPINPEVWLWYYRNIGKEKCPVIDTWWQTETGGIMIAPFPGFTHLKPGSANKPFFGVDPVVLKDDNTPCNPSQGGSLCIKRPWPAIMRTTWGDHERFIDTYFKAFKNVYFTGDGCTIDEEGDYWLMGRIDDVVNVSGHRIGTAEVESALVSHPLVAEAAVVPIPHEIKGEALFAFVTTVEEAVESDTLKQEIQAKVKEKIGSIAVPEKIQFAKALPKTRSGKIMRRILRKIAEGDLSNLGDTSTLADPQVVDDLIKNRVH